MNKLFISAFLCCAISSAIAQSDSIYLWQNAVPGESSPKKVPVITTLDDGSVRVTEETNPFFAVFRPAVGMGNGKAVVIVVGGAYVRLAVHKEGYAVAQWLTGLGYTCFVVHYRVPDKRDGALQDVQRAIRLIRYRAKDYGIDPNRIAAMGFSAGAHIVARIGLKEGERDYPPQDKADSVSFRPNALVIMYPGYLDGGPNRSLTPELKPSATTPDTFIFQSMDDGIVQSAFALAQGLRAAGVNTELHIVPEGGHGYGIYPGNKAAETWPGLLANWLTDHL